MSTQVCIQKHHATTCCTRVRLYQQVGFGQIGLARIRNFPEMAGCGAPFYLDGAFGKASDE
jgi:hypothetical protein